MFSQVEVLGKDINNQPGESGMKLKSEHSHSDSEATIKFDSHKELSPRSVTILATNQNMRIPGTRVAEKLSPSSDIKEIKIDFNQRSPGELFKVPKKAILTKIDDTKSEYINFVTIVPSSISIGKKNRVN